jgi:hypothetical protein
MNINKIFDLFKSEKSKEEQVEEQVVLDGPVLWVGMFVKLIANYEIFTKQIIQFFRTTNQELDVDDIEQASSYMVYMRAYDNLSKLDINDSMHVEAIKMHPAKPLILALESALNYYLEKEEYEKCSHIQKIQNVINPS